jgi:hypothetical protein
MQARRQVVWAIALGLVLPGSSAAQAEDRAQRAFRTSVVGTAIPLVVGTAIMGASDAEGDQVAGYAIASLGLSVGPALGHWQLGEHRTGWLGAGGRLLLAWGSVALAVSALGDCDFWTCSADQLETAELVLVSGHAAAALWALRDIASLNGSAFRLPTRRGPQVRVAPGFSRGGRAPRLVVWAHF